VDIKEGIAILHKVGNTSHVQDVSETAPTTRPAYRRMNSCNASLDKSWSTRITSNNGRFQRAEPQATHDIGCLGPIVKVRLEIACRCVDGIDDIESSTANASGIGRANVFAGGALTGPSIADEGN